MNEARLRTSEARLRLSLDAARIGIWELDPETGRAWRSPWHDRIFGYEEPLPEWTYAMFLGHVVPEHRSRVDAAFQRTLATGEPWEFECRIVRADGVERWLRARGSASGATDVPARRLFGIVEDITERRDAERIRMERSRELALSAAVGVAVTEAGALRPMLQRCAEAVVEHLDAAFARIWTLDDRQQVLELQASAGMYTHLDGAHSRIPIGAYRIGCIAEEREPHLTNAVIGDLRIHDQAWARREGMVAFAGYPLVVEGRVVGVMAMFARHEVPDATFRALGAVADGIALAIQRARVEAALRRSEQELKDFLESAVEGIHFVGPDGTILWANKAELDLLGYSRDEYIGHNIAEFHADQAVIDDMLARLTRKETLQEYEARLRCKDGSIRHVLVDSNVQWRQGEFVTTRCFTRDITALKHAAAERECVLERERIARTEAEEANRAKSEFLAAMSHELRTPLNAIAGYVQLMELGIHGPVTDAQREALGRVQRSQQHLLALINDILNFAKLEAGRIEYELADVSLAEVVADVSSMVGPQLADKGLSYAVDIAPDIIVRADREKLQQILLNLLSNAAKFTPAGGRVTVEAGSRLHGPAGVAFLRVSDTGCGIPLDKQEVIFDPFVQVPARLIRTTEGTGLGLAISRDLARGMNGDLRVRSIEGEGSTFTVALRDARAPARPHEGDRPA